jgi:hypothetical protein
MMRTMMMMRMMMRTNEWRSKTLMRAIRLCVFIGTASGDTLDRRKNDKRAQRKSRSSSSCVLQSSTYRIFIYPEEMK